MKNNETMKSGPNMLLASETNPVSIATIVAIYWYRSQTCHIKAIGPLILFALQGETFNAVYKSKMPDLHQTQIDTKTYTGQQTCFIFNYNHKLLC